MKLINSSAVVTTLALHVLAAGAGATDLILAQQVKLSADDAHDGDSFGWNVAISGDTALVAGTDNDDAGTNHGAVYVFGRNGTTWTQQAKLTGEDSGLPRWPRFGSSMAISGDMVLVGVPGDDDAGPHAGAVYVFGRNGVTWTRQGKLFADEPWSPWSAFGHSMALSGDTLVVTAFSNEFSNYHGAAYVFIRDGTGWTQQAMLTTDERCYWFGYTVALDSDTVLVGAPEAYPFGLHGCMWQELPPPAAFVFVRNGTTWTQQAKFGDDTDVSGYSVAISGDTALATGSVHVFDRTGTTWTEGAGLPADIESGDPAMVISGDMALVGAPGDDDAGTNHGAVYVFGRNGTTWTQQAKLFADEPWPSSRFGHSMALSGDTLVVGAPGDEEAGTNAGAAYVFAPADDDGDGVLDELDVCADTVIPEGAPTRRLGRNRFALVDDDGVFDTNRPPGRRPGLSFTIEETGGCSCEQIIDALGLGQGHVKFGCSIGAMRAWVELVNP